MRPLSFSFTARCALPIQVSVIFHMRKPDAALTVATVPEACRLPYTLKDDQGRVVSYENICCR